MYSDRDKAAVMAASGMSVLLFLASAKLFFIENWAFLNQAAQDCLSLGCVVVSLASTWLAFGYLGSTNKYIKDLHLWTLLEQTALAGVYLFGAGKLSIILLLATAVYPSVVLQKIAINTLSGAAWNYNGTDDPNGNYYNIPSLGIKIPRESFNLRIILALVSIIVFFVFNK
jgi:hypothetical protein